MKGIILKNQNGYFSIAGEGEQLTLCRSRGRLKRKTDILVGDAVEYETGLGSEGVITKVYPRKMPCIVRLSPTSTSSSW